MRIRPIAIGILVVLSGEDFNDSQNFAIDGNKYPDITPMNMARNIQSVRYLSRNLRRELDGIDLNLKMKQFIRYAHEIASLS